MDRRATVESWLHLGLAAVDPERLTAESVGDSGSPINVLAIGKAAPAMCRGLASIATDVTGLCITSHDAEVPAGIELMLGDHPIPGQRSMAAGRRVLELAGQFDIALVSGGGSALCEVPAPGLDLETLQNVHRTLVEGGASIAETNHVRAHLSSIKCGRAGSMPTYVLSDVAGGDPSLVSSGPTIRCAWDPDRAASILESYGITVSPPLENAFKRIPPRDDPASVTVVGDGRTAASAIARAANGTVRGEWLDGRLDRMVGEFIATAPTGVTVGAGEPSLDARAGGRGGRNSHAALIAASLISGSDALFAALASDGVDGNSDAAGAIVDGTTLARGGDPTEALAAFDSATYLNRTGDLLQLGPTGTNVADVWLIWKPEGSVEPILRV